jgi:uncharacterized OsmC-like protein
MTAISDRAVDVEGLLDLTAMVSREPWEAQSTNNVLATRDGDGIRVRCLPMTLGSGRVIRDFEVGPADSVELLLSALGGCMAAAAATSFALRGAVPAELAVEVQWRSAEGLRCQLVGADMESALAHVVEHSSTYRLLAGVGDLRATCNTPEGLRHADARPRALSGPVDPRSVVVTWQGGLRSIAGALDVDQPKQLFGADLGPSPEEYVLAALAAEALHHVWEHEEVLEIHASARRDLRGHLGFPGIPVEQRSVLVQFVGLDVPEALARDWLDQGTVAGLVIGAQHIQGHVKIT